MNESKSNDDESPYHICVSCRHGQCKIDQQLIAQAITTALQLHGRTSCDISVSLVDDAEMCQLHDRYLHINETTDVLSFDLGDGDSSTVDGELVVCVDTAERESRRRGHPVPNELLLYTIHGLLHLLGYDDLDHDAAAKMHEREDELLTSIGIGPVFRGAQS